MVYSFRSVSFVLGLEYCAYLLNSVVLIRCMFYFVCVFVACGCLL